MLSWSRSRRLSQARWSAPDRSRRGLLGEGQERGRVAGLDLGLLAVGGEALRGELADRVELTEAGLALDLLAPDEALVGEGHQPVEDVDADLVGGTADPLRGRQVAAADEHREPGEQPPLALAEQVVAPGDRPA